MILRTLLLWTTGIVLFIVVVFALPLVATGIVLAITMLLSPAVWIVGSSYANNSRQAFFRGGLIAGILPFVVASGVALTLGMGGFFSPIYAQAPSRVFQKPVGVPTVPAALAAPSYPSTATPDAPILNSTTEYPLPEAAVPAQSMSPQATSPYSAPTQYVEYSDSSYVIVLGIPVEVTPAGLILGYADTLAMRLTMAGIWLVPGVFAFFGGGLSYLTFRMVTPNQTHLGALACTAPNATFKRPARDASGSALSEQNVERVASQRG